MLFTQEILIMLFDEVGIDFAQWALDVGYTDQWTDQQIYEKLPSVILPLLGEFGLHASWMDNFIGPT